MRNLALVMMMVLAPAGCGGDSKADGAGGGSSGSGGVSSGGTGGVSTGGTSSGGTSTGGSAGSTGGNAGSTGGSAGSTGGSAGSVGGSGGATGGSGGSVGGSGGATGGSGGSTGGSSGTGGAAPTPECTKDSDCTMWTDCCTCTALAPGETPPASCPAICLQDHCPATGITKNDIACRAGRCVAGYDCDASKVICLAPTPICPIGTVPRISGNCWAGDCVPAKECLFVNDCGSCGKLPCATYVKQLGNEHHCVETPAACGGDTSRACLGPTVCEAPYNLCVDKSGIKGVGCSCPAC